MKQINPRMTFLKRIKYAVPVALFVLSFCLFSYVKASRMTDDFLKQLGISKTAADLKVSGGFLYGSLDQEGVKNAKNIAMGNRAAVTSSLLNYVKKQVNSPAFIKEYNDMREKEKPQLFTPQTPEEMHQDMIKQMNKSITEMELSVKKADPSMKPMFEKMLTDLKNQQKLAEDPNNKQIASYRKNYPQFVKDSEAGNQRSLKQWENKYPSNHLLFVKTRLQQFLDETSDIDFGAEVIEKNGTKYFVNKTYESKGNRWKMAFRAGKPVVETARSFAEQWINEIR
ncbi:hypothetical protein [Flavihumibacter sp. UBA7668]|uniref:hypothetical protein n=1 Tax=Flavihumibacter sp. UBA7668 TaxID=1946542 RepID=UPI0025B892E4|nr:hypothetical protein [Flavihumibacter sp. UBA7668]